MKNEFVIGLIGVMLANSVLAATYTRKAGETSWGVTNQWWTGSDVATLPGALDDVVLNGGKAVDVDTDAIVNEMTVANADTDGTIHINTVGITVSIGTLYVGHTKNAGVGMLNHSAGSVAVSGNTTLGNTVGGAGTFSLTGGDLTVSGTTLINETGLLDVNGGRLSFNQGPTNLFLNGDGLLKLQSGSIETTGTEDRDVLSIHVHTEISGGVVDLRGQTRLNAQLDIMGDAATIDIDRLSGAEGGGVLNFVFNDTGISPIDVAAFMTLDEIDLVVDGSAYTGSATSFVLLSSGNNTHQVKSYSVTGFGTEGEDWELVQLLGSGGVGAVVLNLIPERGTLGLIIADNRV